MDDRLTKQFSTYPTTALAAWQIPEPGHLLPRPSRLEHDQPSASFRFPLATHKPTTCALLSFLRVHMLAF
jgi:hypothetical protein